MAESTPADETTPAPAPSVPLPDWMTFNYDERFEIRLALDPGHPVEVDVRHRRQRDMPMVLELPEVEGLLGLMRRVQATGEALLANHYVDFADRPSRRDEAPF